MPDSAIPAPASAEQQARRARPSKRQANPLRRGIISFCAKGRTPEFELSNTETVGDLTTTTTTTRLSVEDLPKRFTSYPPLLLLPFNFARHSEPWARLYDTLSDDEKTKLFQSIAEDGFSGLGITHVAINAPIALSAENGHDGSNLGEDETCPLPVRRQNVMRSPSGLVPVYGDWGIRDGAANAFEGAFWVSASQHKGITQSWAPLYTMFSRGNISEKARILGIGTGAAEHPNHHHHHQPSFHGLSRDQLGQDVKEIDVVDFYVGIGYFAFCYLMRGVRRVWGWDINPWSIEGLRRGCQANGWKCLVVRVDEHGSITDPTPREIVREILQHDSSDGDPGQVRCVAFLGDNRWAPKVLGEISKEISSIVAPDGQGPGINLRHANLGLLPSSKDSWESAVVALSRLSNRGHRPAWLHVHENVDLTKEDSTRADIVNEITKFVSAESSHQPQEVSCVHLHHVKTFAPGVMHCVFDIQIQS